MENKLFLDIETTGLDVKKDRILCVGVKLNEQEVQVFTDKEAFKEWVVYKVFNSSPKRVGDSITWGGHNVSFDAKFLNTLWGVGLPDSYIDTKLIAHSRNPHESHRLKDLAKTYLKEEGVIRLQDLQGKGKKKLKLEEVDTELLKEYCKQDVELCYRLWKLWTV